MKGKHRRIVVILTVISIVITVINVSWDFILRMYIQYKFNIRVNSVNAFGIIGSADGPTAIFLSSNHSSRIITIIFTTLSALGLIYLILTRKRRDIQ